MTKSALDTLQQLQETTEGYRIRQPGVGLIPKDEPTFLLRAEDKGFIKLLRLWVQEYKNLEDYEDVTLVMIEHQIERTKLWRKAIKSARELYGEEKRKSRKGKKKDKKNKTSSLSV